MSILSGTVTIKAPLSRCFALLTEQAFLHYLTRGTNQNEQLESGRLVLSSSLELEVSLLGLSSSTFVGEMVCFEPEQFLRLLFSQSPFSHLSVDIYFDIDDSGFSSISWILDYSVGSGVVANLFEVHLLDRFLRSFMTGSATKLKACSETSDWKIFLSTEV